MYGSASLVGLLVEVGLLWIAGITSRFPSVRVRGSRRIDPAVGSREVFDVVELVAHSGEGSGFSDALVGSFSILPDLFHESFAKKFIVDVATG